VGIARTDRIFYSAAAGIGNPVVYVGSKTGRDGIHGATMASADFSEDSEEKRPTVQVGDPFTEKLLIEACLELMATDAIVAIQDMGAAGLTSSSVEMASKGGVGIRLDMDAVPCREDGMTPYEMMLSESQERMLMVLKPARKAAAEAIFRKWELDFAVIGEITDSGRMVLEWRGETVADIPLAPLADDAPLYDRPHVPTPSRAPLGPVASDSDIGDDLVRLMGSPDLASRRWIWEQYDHMVGADTVQRPGGDAAIVRVHDSAKGLAIATDCTPRYCYADPVEGGRQAIAECWRNLTAVGAVPLAATDCMNFGNPQRPEVMGQFVGCIEGMAEACTALAFPIVSGNVSLYNETKADDGSGRAILPTPAIGGIGLIDDVALTATIAFKSPSESIWLIGATHGHLGQSIWLREIAGAEDGPPPPVDLAAELHTGNLVRRLVRDGMVTAVHDCADGGLLVAIAEMALAGGIGAEVEGPAGPVPAHEWFFGEDQARYVVTTDRDDRLIDACRAAGIAVVRLGRTGGDAIAVAGARIVPLDRLRKSHEAFLPRLMRQPA
jgi:phosphoribosylformylglycinamidine synthase